MKLTNILLFVIVLLLIPACTPQKRLQLLLKQHPELTQIDTIKDTTIIKETKIDSVFTASTGDTIILTKDRIITQFVRLATDSFFIETTAKADTIIKQIKVDKIVYKQEKNALRIFVNFIMGIMLGMLFISGFYIYLLSKRR